MVVGAVGVIPNQYHNFLLVRGEKNGGEDSRLCDAIFGTGTHITDVSVEVLRLICNNRGGGRRWFAYDL